MKLPNHFDLIAPFYEIVIPAAHTEELVQIGNFPVDGYVLDIGGGTGRVAKLLGKIQNNIFILDASRAMLRMANDHKLIEKVCGNAEEIPFRDNYFDRV
ncbi:MAG: class I SAM-dependent methyltransferase, partial [Anaerolineales bacterium]